VLNTLKDGHRDRLIRIIQSGDFGPENERYIVGVCMEFGAFTQTHQSIDRHLERAAESLSRFATSPAKELLSGVVSDLRTYATQQVENFAGFAREAAG